MCRIAGGCWLVAHAAIIVGIALLDLLLVSPLRLGEAAYYYRLTQGQERSREATCAFQSVRDTGVWRRPVGYPRIRTCAPGGAEGTRCAPSGAIFAADTAKRWGGGLSYGAGVRSTVLACYAPAALLWGYGEVLRMSGDASALTDITRLFCGLFGLFALAAGWVVQQLLMLRFLPAQFRLAEGASLREALQEFPAADEREHRRGRLDVYGVFRLAGRLLASFPRIVCVAFVSDHTGGFCPAAGSRGEKRPAALPVKASSRPERQPSA